MSYYWYSIACPPAIYLSWTVETGDRSAAAKAKAYLGCWLSADHPTCRRKDPSTEVASTQLAFCCHLSFVSFPPSWRRRRYSFRTSSP
ncbi:hypothetical protein Agabi119p4_1058 [Agaricus bisporus var. burnettii]|uniref:Uncharacterized protein n=1 Tax=Agaricus bisporus var. burnettii TaxID=192524 RepID=A0A8H7FC89_AGABI|nr:hypothetical protein Agabi119p4_1058 [Agaricus bisporus var. burnettii]